MASLSYFAQIYALFDGQLLVRNNYTKGHLKKKLPLVSPECLGTWAPGHRGTWLVQMPLVYCIDGS